MESKVVVLTITYGKRWHFLSQVIDAVMKDEHVTKLVIVDNGSKNKEELIDGTRKFGDKISIIHLEQNLGSAGGFSVGIEAVRELDCNFVLMLDDDNVPEQGSIEKFLAIRKELGKEKVVLVGNRVDLPGNEDVFYEDTPKEVKPKGTFFESLSFKKVGNFLGLLTDRKRSHSRSAESRHIVPNESFVYGGAFIPIDAIQNAPLPDRNLILYGDDIEYSWGIKRLGYESYVCYSPKIYDLETSFGEGSQAVGLFDPKTAAFKAYYRVRNMVLISRRNTQQTKVALFVNIIIWIHALALLGFLHYGPTKAYFKKLFLVYQAAYAGYFPTERVPKEAQLP